MKENIPQTNPNVEISTHLPKANKSERSQQILGVCRDHVRERHVMLDTGTVLLP